VRGNILSNHQKIIVVQFMAACCSKSKTDAFCDADDVEDLREDEKEHPCGIPVKKIHESLVAMGQEDKKHTADKMGEDGTKSNKSAWHMSTASRIGAALWDIDSTEWSSQTVEPQSELGPSDCKSAEKKKKNILKKDKGFKEHAYINMKEANVNAWLHKLCNPATDAKGFKPKAPNEKQLNLLQAVRMRCAREAAEMRQPKSKRTEPMRAALIGVPGAGKSQCIKWLRSFYTDCLEWTDSDEFQFLAPQNTMAALIGGATVHSWGQAPINHAACIDLSQKQKGKDGVDDLFTRCQASRWLVIDECSNLALLVQLKV